MSVCVAVLGGSFDPVHHGHVALAGLFARLLHPDALRILPAGQPWQKAGLQAGDADRVAMLELAFAQASGAGFPAGVPVTIDTREIVRAAPTYTVETLREQRAELGASTSIVFLMGADQLQKLDSWRDWRSLFELANFGVAARPGYRLDGAALPPAVAHEIAGRLASPERVRASPAGRVCMAHTLAVDISATQVRQALKSGPDPQAQRGAGQGRDPGQVGALVAPQVLDYIQQRNLYKS
ncbi:nicotinate-nucleotide adenylyltransferase [Massilia forsythiae]|uniref:Probable nicotinate-nucleotide adenylyltransferase n=1 Tax=Massilia forsythiae TaxID=2728020 RepID=A0A7Z2VXM9_9BURK|nr:nicotinate-nucleotide adenylyltransferase [Massilia forsythiae]QJE00727.1 nicotinate-nucleotide adenylyltransferase [Massilia forsythiae]